MKSLQKAALLVLALLIGLPAIAGKPASAAASVVHDQEAQTATITEGNLAIRVDYGAGASIQSLRIGGVETLSESPIHTFVDTGTGVVSSLELLEEPVVTADSDSLEIAGIRYGNGAVRIEETWSFRATGEEIELKVDRTYAELAELTSLPGQGTLTFSFAPEIWDTIIRTEDGGSLFLRGHGSDANDRFLDLPNEAYGFETASLDYINKANGFILQVEAESEQDRATEVIREADTGNLRVQTRLSGDGFTYAAGNGNLVEIGNRHTYSYPTQKIFAPTSAAEGEQVGITYRFSTESAAKYYDIGTIAGLDTEALASLITDFGRSTVIDLHYGQSDTSIESPVGTGPYETAFYAWKGYTMGQGDGYMQSLKNTIDLFRTRFQFPDGHMYSVAWNRRGDSAGLKEDSKRDAEGQYAAGVADIYRLTGDAEWLARQKESVEGALDYLISQDTDNNGLTELDSDHQSEKKTHKEWTDAVYVSYESSYINSWFYQGLVAWADMEELLGDAAQAEKYRAHAAKLKETFNKDVADGGFWSPLKNAFVWWRNKDGSPGGDVRQTQPNMNAVLFGMVTPERAAAIIGNYESFIQDNNIRYIPHNLDPYPYGLALDMNYPFPSYLNGTIFPQDGYEWIGALAMTGNRDLAYKYANITLEQYNTDNLFGEVTPYKWDFATPAGGVYEKWFGANVRPAAAIYRYLLGIQPMADKLVVDPYLPRQMYGTVLKYPWKGDTFDITYHNEYSRSVDSHGSSVPVEFRWNGLFAGQTYEVIVEHLVDGVRESGQAVADGAGNLVYEVPAGAAYRISIQTQGEAGIDIEAPAAPELSFVSHDDVNRRVKLAWEASSDNRGVAGYNIYRGETSDFEPSMASLIMRVDGTEFEDVYLQGTRYYKITAVDAAFNESLPSEAITVEPQGPAMRASYTYNRDSLAEVSDGVVSYTDSPRSRWTAYQSPNATDWIESDYGRPVTLEATEVYLYSDGGGVKAASALKVQYLNDEEAWTDVPDQVRAPLTPAGNALNTISYAPVTAQKFRVLITHAPGSKSGVTEIKHKRVFAGLSFDRDHYSLVEGGDTGTHLWRQYSGGLKLDAGEAAEYATSDDSVATVGADGRIAAVGPGAAIVTASLDGATATASVAVEAALHAPTWPEGSELSSSDAGETNVTLSWTAAQGEVERYRIASGDRSWEVGGESTSYEVTGLEAGTSYTFTVQAGNEAGWTTDGPALAVTTLDESGPSPTVDPEPTPTTDPGPSPTVDPEPTPTTDPGPSPTVDPEPTPTTDPGPSPTVDPEPTPTTDPGPSPTVDPEPTPTTDPGPSPTVDPGPTPTTDPGPSATPSPGPSSSPSPKPTASASPQPTAIDLPVDVPQTHWAADAVEKAIAIGYVDGYPDGSFRPDKQVSRAELATMLGRAFKLESEPGATGPDFADADHIPSWAWPHVAGAALRGIVGGYEDGTFRPDRPVTRSELAAMAVRLLGLPVPQNAAAPFADWDAIPVWARPYVAAAYEHGLMRGVGHELFAPERPATRAEAATLINALMDNAGA